MQENRVALPGPRMPADHGLTGLGFIMMLGGMIYTLLMALMLGIALMGAMLGRGHMSNEEWLLLLFCALSVARSALHTRAGRALVYGFAGGAVGPTRVYVIAAAIHTVLAALLLHSAMGGDKFWIPLVLMMAAWPVVVAIFALRTPVANTTDSQLPHPADGGFESLSVLMTVFGLMGACLVSLALIGVMQSGALEEVMGLLFVGVLALLLVRSVMHVRAGITGLRGVSRGAFVDQANSYARIGFGSALAVGGWFMIVIFREGAQGGGAAMLIVMLYIGITVWLLLAWPRIVRQFIDERVGYAGAEQRAADRGMTALGWMLLAGGSVGVAAQLGMLIASPGAMRGGAEMFMAFGMSMAHNDTQRWAGIVAGVLQLWAGIELVRMTSRFKIAAVTFGLVGIVTTVVINLEVFEMMDRLGASAFQLGGRQGALIMFVAIIMSLVLPATALVLALRREQAGARVVSRD